MRRTLLVSSSFVLVFALGILAARAADEKPAGAAADSSKAASPEAMMAEWMKYAQPSEGHAKLKPTIGTFDAEMEMQMAPDAPAIKSKGKMVNEFIFDGRYLKGEYTGEFMGKPFKGLSYTAYDNLQKKYVGTWIDDMSTMLMVSEGQMDGSGKVLTMLAECPEPGQTEKKKVRQVLTIQDEDHHTYEAFQLGPDGKETKMMSIKYTRAK
jgi:hypothetical protein